MIVVIKNETHQLFDEQQMLIEQLATNADEIKVLEVPADGWDLQEMNRVLENFESYPNDTKFIFVSPIPYLLKETVKRYCDQVLIFHNDRREKKELPDGRIIQVVSSTCWQLI
jgi:hypothetical protein